MPIFDTVVPPLIALLPFQGERYVLPLRDYPGCCPGLGAGCPFRAQTWPANGFIRRHIIGKCMPNPPRRNTIGKCTPNPPRRNTIGISTALKGNLRLAQGNTLGICARNASARPERAKALNPGYRVIGLPCSHGDTLRPNG